MLQWIGGCTCSFEVVFWVSSDKYPVELWDPSLSLVIARCCGDSSRQWGSGLGNPVCVWETQCVSGTLHSAVGSILESDRSTLEPYLLSPIFSLVKWGNHSILLQLIYSSRLLLPQSVWSAHFTFLPLLPLSKWLLLYVLNYRSFVQLVLGGSRGWWFCNSLVILMWLWETVSIAFIYSGILTGSLLIL